MNTRQFWVDHFAPPAPELQKTFVALTPPDCAEILEAIGAPQAVGTQYESPENRVFGFGEVVLKIYRPGRWSRAALQEEVQFLEDLRDADVPFVRPIGGLGTWRGLHYLAYEAVPGPFDVDPKTLDEASVRELVHLAARLHDVGAKRAAPNRPTFDPGAMCAGCFDVIRSAGFLPTAQQGRYGAAIDRIVAQLAALGEIPVQRIHGDLYSGNALWRPQGPVLMDLDDFQVGPVALDLSLLSSSWRLDTLPAALDRAERRAVQHRLVLDLYREVRPFPSEWEPLVPLVRGCRAVEFDAWLSSRWKEPGFAEHYDQDDMTDPDWWRESVEGLERATG